MTISADDLLCSAWEGVSVQLCVVGRCVEKDVCRALELDRAGGRGLMKSVQKHKVRS